MTQKNANGAEDNEPVGHPLYDNPWFKKMKTLNENLEAGKITQAEYERKHRGLMVELQSAASKEREKIKSWAISSKKVRDEAEYKRLCAHYHDAYGDSFHHFLTSIHAGASFLTLNEKMLDGRPALGAAVRRQDHVPGTGNGGGGKRESRAGEEQRKRGGVAGDGTEFLKIMHNSSER